MTSCVLYLAHKGWLAEILGIGDFYYEISVQVIEACQETADIDGGIIDLDLVVMRVNKKRGSNGVPISSFVVHAILNN